MSKVWLRLAARGGRSLARSAVAGDLASAVAYHELAGTYLRYAEMLQRAADRHEQEESGEGGSHAQG